MKRLLYLTAAIACLACTACRQDAGTGTATGFDTPDLALDAYRDAMEQGDAAAFRSIMARDREAIEGFDAIVSMETDMSPEEAAKVNLQALAPMQGFGDVRSKRFPAEIDGNRAEIVQVFEDNGFGSVSDRFRRWQFEKSGGKWYLVGSEFGQAADLPEKYTWDKDEAAHDDAD